MADGVARHLNSLLAVVGGHTETISQQLGSGHSLQRELGEIRRVTERSRAVARDLLAFSGGQVADREAVAPAEVAAGLRHSLWRTIGERVELALEDESARALVLGDRAQIATVITKLAANATEAMPAGGRLTVRIAANTATRVVGSSAREVTIAVSDTGEGMTVATRERMFEPFFTTRAEGHHIGLGLSAVRESSTSWAAGSASSRPAGTAPPWWSGSPGCRPFRGALPSRRRRNSTRCQSPAGTAGTAGRAATAGAHDPRRRGRRPGAPPPGAVLRRAGHDVLSAATGAAALELLRDRLSPIDLLLTDMVLPDVHGGHLARQALTIRPELRVLYTSGDDGVAPVRDGMPPGDGFLGKPYTSDKLTLALRAAFAPPPRWHDAQGRPQG